MTTDNQILIARTHLATARNVTVLTGAGISADSGVPTFRGAEGLWRTYRAEDLATPEAFEQDPRLVWEWYNWRRELIATKQPNPAHDTLVELERRWTDRSGSSPRMSTACIEPRDRDSCPKFTATSGGFAARVAATSRKTGRSLSPLLPSVSAMPCPAPATHRLVWGIALGGRSASL